MVEPNLIRPTPSEPRLSLRTPEEIRTESARDEIPTVTIPPHGYGVTWYHRLSMGLGALLRGEIRHGVGVTIGTSDPTLRDAERGPLAMMDFIRNRLEGFKSWKTTFLGILTGVSVAIASFTGSGIGDGTMDLISTILAVAASIALIWIKPEPKEPTP